MINRLITMKSVSGNRKRTVQKKSTPFKKPRKSGGSPSGVREPPTLLTKKIKNTTRCALCCLLSLARIEANDPSGYVTLRIDDLIRDAVDRSESSSERFGVPIEIGDGARGLQVVGDRAQLLSAIHNLVENAIKYSDKGLAIVVSADLDDSAHTVRVSVTDRGIGIPARDRERIFERFYRVDRARARDTGGTGLGLAIVRHIAVNHGGDITVRSLEGDGSTFTLTLPQRVDQ